MSANGRLLGGAISGILSMEAFNLIAVSLGLFTREATATDIASTQATETTETTVTKTRGTMTMNWGGDTVRRRDTVRR